MDSEHKNAQWEEQPLLWCDLFAKSIDWRKEINILTPSYTLKSHKTIGEKLEPRDLKGDYFKRD